MKMGKSLGKVQIHNLLEIFVKKMDGHWPAEGSPSQAQDQQNPRPSGHKRGCGQRMEEKGRAEGWRRRRVDKCRMEEVRTEQRTPNPYLLW